MDLAEAVGQLQRRMSRFRRVALHIHSPASYDWGQTSQDPSDRREALLQEPRPYLECLESQYDLVAITDHVQSQFACTVCAGLSHCVVLPGMELSVQLQPPFASMRVHFLVLFPEGSSGEVVDRIFLGHSMPGPGSRSGKEVIQVRDIQDLAEAVHSAGGLLLAAHVDGGNGYRSAFRDTGAGVLQLVCDQKELDDEARGLCDQFKEHLVTAGVDAIEIRGVTDAKHYRFTMGGQGAEVATVLRNDAHTLEQLRDGQRTYVKMTDLTLHGLRQALRFPDTRVRHSPPLTGLPSIEGVRVRGGSGTLADVTIAFSPNLSCVIGARGTGKSTIVEALRYVFGYNREMGRRIGDDLRAQVEGRQEATLKSATIEVLYSSAPDERYLLTAGYQPKRAYQTTVFDDRNRDTHVGDIERDGRFPCRLYGWSEIERLGREPSHQRDLLDHMLELHAMLAEREQLTRDLIEDRVRIEAEARALEGLYEECEDLQHLRELQQNFDIIKDPDVEPLFADVDLWSQATVTAKRWQARLEQWLQDLSKALGVPTVELDEGTRVLWDAKGGEALIGSVGEAASALKSAAGELLTAVTTLAAKCGERHGAAVATLQERLQGRGDVEDLARRRATLSTQLQKAREQEREYREALAKLKDALAERKTKVSGLLNTLEAISAARQRGIRGIEAMMEGAKGPNIGITITPRGDTDRYCVWLEAAIKGAKPPWQTRERIVSVLAGAYGPGGIVQAMLDRQLPQSGLRESDSDILDQVLFPLCEDVGSGVTRVRPDILSVLLEADEHPANDRVEVTLDGKPIGSLSPGQRCSALLPVVLLGSSAPLVLDQPEDNLDNQLITDLLIHTLHELKERRQVIVVTHNPNIVVTGDAEQVVVMEAEDGKCRVRQQASIDDIAVMRDIVDLMEGGRDALRRRFKRYWPQEDIPDLAFLDA